MNKRERLERTIAGETVDRPPIALWRLFPGDDQRAADLARSTVEFQRTYDWDFARISPSITYCTSDYGLHDEWEGAIDGERTIKKRAITRSLDWTVLRPLDPQRGGYGKQLECIELTYRQLGDEIPILATIFSPLAQAEMLCGPELFSLHLRKEPDRLRSALNVLTENILRYVEMLRRLPIAGTAYVIRHASYHRLSEDEYAAFGLPFDIKVLDSLPSKWWFNMVSLECPSPIFKFAMHLHGQAINWADRENEPDLAIGKTLHSGAVCGGLSNREDLYHGTPTTVREAVRSALEKTSERRIIIGAGYPLNIATPLSNIRAARQAVEGL